MSIESEGQTLEELLVSADIGIEDRVVRDAVLEELSEAIDALPELQREVILRQAMGGETFRQISEATGVPVNTLLARKRCAIATLRSRLQEVRETIIELLANGSQGVTK